MARRHAAAVAAVYVTLLCVSNAAQPGSEVTSLPGWSGPLPSKIYSGVLSAGSDSQDGVEYSQFHQYLFIESEGDPATDPVVVWSNGGPGAASYFGLFVEAIGPFQLDAASLQTASYNETGVPTLFRSPYTWTAMANVLILNSPPPVGFSYCEPAGVTGGPQSCGSWNDTRTAQANTRFLESFAAAFPEFVDGHDWFIIGESYAGVYVPTLAREILSNKSSMLAPQLAGIAVGDPCLGMDVICGPGEPGPFYYQEFLHGHGQFSDKLHDQILDACPRSDMTASGCAGCTQQCKDLISSIADEVGGYYAYNLYDECWDENSVGSVREELQRLLGQRPDTRKWFGPPHSVAPRAAKRAPSSAVGAALNGYPCGGGPALAAWMNSSAVRTALHVPTDAYYFSADNGNGFVYNLTEKNLLPFLTELVSTTKVRVLVYNGDTDPSINSFLTQNWTSYLADQAGFKEKEGWRPWTRDGQVRVSGYVTEYDVSSRFSYLTVRGSGHMVPEYQAASAQVFMRSWLANDDFPRYVPPSAQTSEL